MGLPHGFYKVTAKSGDKTVWTHGNINSGNITNDCYVVTDNEVIIYYFNPIWFLKMGL